MHEILRKNFSQISETNLMTISDLITIVEVYVQDFKFCKNESSQTLRVFRNKEYRTGILIDFIKESIWFQDDSLFFQLGCMEDSPQRKFVERLVESNLNKLITRNNLNNK